MQESHDLHGMTARTLRALWRSRRLITPEFRANPANRQAFIKLFQSESGVLHEFRRMNQLDILGAYLPAFGRIVGQMQHDLSMFTRSTSIFCKFCAIFAALR
jgi:[protein-PII] uridylyltransferase